MNRKEFFKNAGRWTIISGIGVLSTFLAYNHKVVTPDKCSVAPQCKDCDKFAQCGLPPAIMRKKDGK
jgi:hypothetical protein